MWIDELDGVPSRLTSLEDFSKHSIEFVTSIDRLSWKGHIQRLDKSEITKIITKRTPDKRRKVRRHNIIWMDDVLHDIISECKESVFGG